MADQSGTLCPDCKVILSIPSKSEVGQIVECANCGAEIEILSLDPLRYEILEEEK